MNDLCKADTKAPDAFFFRSIFWCFALLHCLTWSLVPTLTRNSYRDDVLEQYSLAREWTLATTKHPNFPAWVLAPCNLLTDYAYGVPYFLAQGFILLALWSLWRFGRQIMSESAALLGSLVFCLFIYCNGRTIEYGHMTAILSLWCVSLCMLYGALRWNRLRYWIAAGLALGAGLNTYFMVFNLCFAILVFMLWNPEARRRWRGVGPWLTLSIAVLCFVPQVFRMIESGSITSLGYVSHKTTMGGVWSHLTSPLFFLGGQFLVVLPMLIPLIAVIGFPPKRRRLEPEEKFTSHFLLFFTFFPFACFLLYIVTVGGNISVRHGSQLWSLLGLLVLFHFETNESRKFLSRSAAMAILLDVVILAFTLSEALVFPRFAGPAFCINFPIRELGQRTQAVWDRHFTTPCRFIGGEYRLAAAAGIGMSDHPLVQANWKTDANLAKHTGLTLHSDDETNRGGGVILWTRDGRPSYPNDAPKNLFERYPKAVLQPPLEFILDTGAQKVRVEIGIALIPPPGS